MINGSSVGWLLRVLGMSELPEDRRFMLNAAARKLAAHTEAYVASMRQSSNLLGVNWKLVEKNLVQVAIASSEC